MLKEVKVAAFEGGQLRVLASGDSEREVVLGLPLSRLIVKMVKVPVDQDAVEFATPILQAMSPFPDERLTVSCETVLESETERCVIAAALPESAADDIGEALDGAKLNVTRVDALELGALRGLWNEIVAGDASSVRRLVLLDEPDCISVVALDGDHPSAIRAITDRVELRREVMLSLLEAEDFGGSMPLKEIVVVSRPVAEAEPQPETGDGESPAQQVRPDYEALTAFAPVRKIAITDLDAPLRGVAERAGETGSLDVLPESWRDFLAETRFKAKMIRSLAVAVGVWLLVVGVLVGVPMVYGFMTDYQKGLCRDHQRQYRAVKEMKGKVELVRKYSDHARGALEIMKAVSDRLPEGMELSSWDYKREDGLRISGEADSANDIYKFKDEMIELGGEDRVFAAVNLTGPRAGRAGRQTFDLECKYESEESE